MRPSKETVAILSTGFLPIPATRGGAVENLTENVLRENEVHNKIHIVVYSVHEASAQKIADNFKYTEFRYISIPKLIKACDTIIFTILRAFFRRRNTSSFRYILQRAYFIIKVARDLSIHNYDRLLFENEVMQTIALRLFGNYRQYRGKYYIHIHNEVTRTFGSIRYIMSARIITVSDFIRQSLLRKLVSSGQSPDELTIRVLRNAVNDKLFNRTYSAKEIKEIRQRLGINRKDKVILYSGRLSSEKGIDILVNAINRMKYRNFVLLVVGSSFFGTDIKNPFIHELTRLAKPNKHKIMFTGYVNYSEMPDVYAIADVVVVPSICNDAAPLAVIESVTAGLPIITTRMGGIPEYVNARCAIILDADDNLEENIAKSLDSLLSQPNLLKAMREESRGLAREMTLREYYSQLLQLLDIQDKPRRAKE